MLRISLLEKESSTPYEHSMEHIDATITFSRRCNKSQWRIDTELANQVNQCEQCRKLSLSA